jgi:hypothetical protein
MNAFGAAAAQEEKFRDMRTTPSIEKSSVLAEFLLFPST